MRETEEPEGKAQRQRLNKGTRLKGGGKAVMWRDSKVRGLKERKEAKGTEGGRDGCTAGLEG